MLKLTNDWSSVLGQELEKEYFLKLTQFLQNEYSTKQVFPDKKDIFNAFDKTAYKDVKVLILGQDPYHEINQAHGLCFSVQKGVKIPPSLVNIFKELNSDLGLPIPSHGNLEHWAKQGVLLINTTLTVQAHKANSHSKIGWQQFTDAVMKAVNNIDRPLVVMLWGAPAQQKIPLFTNDKHLILKAPHPSPLSAYRGFFGCRHFSKANEFLVRNNVKPIDWTLEK